MRPRQLSAGGAVQEAQRRHDHLVRAGEGREGQQRHLQGHEGDDRDRGGGGESERGNSGRHAGLRAPVDRVGGACVHAQLAPSSVVRDAVGVVGVDGHSRAIVEAEVHVGADTRLTFDDSAAVSPISVATRTHVIVMVRYIDSDGSVAAPRDGSTYTIGLNNYLAGQNAKWTTEVIMDESGQGEDSDVTTFATQLQFYF